MGRYNDKVLLAVFETDAVTNSLLEPTTTDYPVGTTVPITTIAAPVGPGAIYIHHVVVMFGDIVITDPSADRYLGWAVWAAPDGGTGPTFVSVKGYTADNDLPMIHENGVDAGTAVAPAVNTPFDLLSYVGALGERADTAPVGDGGSPIRVTGHWFQVRLATYTAGALAATTGLDDVSIWVYGRRVGAP